MIKNLPGILAICLVMALAVSAGAQDVQLLQNGGFETWTAGPTGPPDHWINDSQITSTREATIIHGGLYSANLTWINQDQSLCDFMADAVPVTEGSAYACTVWVYDNDNRGQVRVSFFSNVGNSYSTVYSQDIGWQELTFEWTAPAGATSLTVALRAYDNSANWDGEATVYVDDYVLWGPEIHGNSAPLITNVLRFPYPMVYNGDITRVSAQISDPDGSVASDSLYKRVLPGAFAPVLHDSIAGGGIYWFTVGAYNAGDSVEYYVAATDNLGERSQSPTRGYTVLGSTPGAATIYSLQHTTNPGVLPNCYPTDSSGVHTLTGIVAGRYEGSTTHNRFFLREPGSAWNGVYVYNSISTAEIGDSVTVTGIIADYYAETEFSTITSHVTHSSGRPVPNPIVVSAANFSPDSCNATAEPYEGMLIQINNLTVIDSAGNGDFWAVSGTDSVVIMNDMYAGGTTPPTITIGQLYDHIRGIARYTYGMYRIGPRIAADVLPHSLTCTGGNIFNVENSFDPGGDTTQCWPSPRANDTVTVCGIVTAVMQGTSKRFYLQDQANTFWGGMYCYDYRLDNGDTIRTAVGDYIQITSRVKEYYGWTEFDSVLSYYTLGTGQPLPDTTVITVSNLAALCEYTTEPYENILVRVNNVTVVSDNGFGEFWIRDNLGTDSIRIDSDLWQYGTDQPSPVPSVGALYDYVIGVVKWEGRQGSGYDRGWVIFPRFASDYDQAVIPEPNLADVWSIDNTTLAVTFDRIMDPASVGNPSHYTTFSGLSITAAVLDPTNHRKAILTTAAQPNNVVDTLIVTGVCDSLGYCMTTPHRELFHSGITTIATVQTPDAGGDSSAIVGHIVTVKGVIVSDSTMSHPTNPFINDGSGPPYNGVLFYSGGMGMAQPLKGDTVVFTARVDEYFRATELGDLGDFDNFSLVGTGPDPIPYETTAAGLNGNKEGFEGVLVTLCDSFIVTNAAFDLYGFTIRSLSSPSDSLIIHKQAIHTTYSYVPVVGDIFRGVTGVFRYQRDQYRLMPRYDADFNSFATWCGAGPGTGTIAGHVVQQDGTTPIADVTIQTFNSSDVLVASNTSGSLGEYEVTLDPGTYREVFHKTGYVDTTITGIVVVAGSPTPVLVAMRTSSGGNCVYIRGDINNNGAANGIDVVYGVNYFKGNTPPPVICDMCPQAQPFYAAGDVNGNCAFNGIDITFFVNYLKGIQPALLNCPTCPPAAGLAIPRLNSGTATEQGQ